MAIYPTSHFVSPTLLILGPYSAGHFDISIPVLAHASHWICHYKQDLTYDADNNRPNQSGRPTQGPDAPL